MRKRVISALLALLLLAALCLPVSAARPAYDPSAAIAFAKLHWNDGIGECAEFVSRCLQAGGCGCYSMRCSELVSMLRASGLCTEYTLPVNADMTVTVPDDPTVLTQGDAVFFFCSAQGEYQHAVLFDGADENGLMRVFAHMNGNNASKRYVYSARCPECGRASVDTVTVMHFSVNDAPPQPELKIRPGNSGTGGTVSFYWKNTQRASCFDLYFERLEENGRYGRAVRLHDVKSGCSIPLAEGEYRIWLRAVNEEACLKKGEQAVFSESEKCTFTVLPASPVAKPAGPATSRTAC